MTHEVGTHLGGVRTLEDLRLRCVCRQGDECWHYRDARGREPKWGTTAKIWVHGLGKRFPVTIVAWQLAGRERPAAGLRIGRTCDSRHCVNPAHLAALTCGEIAERKKRLGLNHTPARKRALELNHRMRKKVPDWAAEMVCDTSKKRADLAKHFGCSVGCINAARARFRGASGVA